MLERRSQLGGVVPRARWCGRSRCRRRRRRRTPSSSPAPSAPASTTMAFSRLIAEPGARPGDRHAGSCRSSPTRRAPSAWTRSSRRSASTTRSASATRRSTRSCCSPTSRRTDGQILEEGITEAGAMADFTAAGTAYATHGEPMIPFYIFYSMFGFQRTGDQVWAFGDARGRGFLMGATAGRTTLTGEGLQHDDGHSHILAQHLPEHPSPTTRPSPTSWRSSCARASGRMYGEARRGRLLLRHPLQRELGRCRPSPMAWRRASCAACTGSEPADEGSRRVQLLGVGLDPAPGAPRRSRCWRSATTSPPTCGASRRSSSCATRRSRSSAGTGCTPRPRQRVPYVVQQLGPTEGPIVAATDYLKALPRHGGALDRPALHRARHRWLRPQRHARGAAHPLRGQPRADRLRRAPRAVPDRRSQPRASWHGPSASWGSIPSASDPLRA